MSELFSTVCVCVCVCGTAAPPPNFLTVRPSVCPGTDRPGTRPGPGPRLSPRLTSSRRYLDPRFVWIRHRADGVRVSGSARGFLETHRFLRSGRGESAPVPNRAVTCSVGLLIYYDL